MILKQILMKKYIKILLAPLVITFFTFFFIFSFLLFLFLNNDIQVKSNTLSTFLEKNIDQHEKNFLFMTRIPSLRLYIEKEENLEYLKEYFYYFINNGSYLSIHLFKDEENIVHMKSQLNPYQNTNIDKNAFNKIKSLNLSHEELYISDEGLKIDTLLKNNNQFNIDFIYTIVNSKGVVYTLILKLDFETILNSLKKDLNFYDFYIWDYNGYFLYYGNIYKEQTKDMNVSDGIKDQLSRIKTSGSFYNQGYYHIQSNYIFGDNLRYIQLILFAPAYYFIIFFISTLTIIIIFIFINFAYIYYLTRNVSEQISNPIQNLSLALKEFLEQLETSPKIIKIFNAEGDEVQNLIMSFNTMSEKIIEHVNHLENKVLERTSALQSSQTKMEKLLYNILPQSIAVFLSEQQNGVVIAHQHPDASILFLDLVNFTSLSEQLGSYELVELLNTIFSKFDALLEEKNLEKIKTIGDAYMVVGGIPKYSENHAENLLNLAFKYMQIVHDLGVELKIPLAMRSGIHRGSVIAGVIGNKRIIYDLWGRNVNFAARLEQHGEPQKVNMSEEFYNLLKTKEDYSFSPMLTLNLKGLGDKNSYLCTLNNNPLPSSTNIK